MKKLLLLLAFCSIFSIQAQIIPDAPWMLNLDIENNNSPIYFQDIVDAGEAYFATIDKDAKGSGYKPFKRWENYWQNFVDADGYLPTDLELWNTYLQAQSRSANRDTQVDESNWISLGPTDFNNQSTSFANIGRVNVIIQDPSNFNTFYVGTPSGGLWKSTDAGLNWTVLTDDLPQIGASGIAIDKNDSDIIYIATGDDDANDSFSVGVWKSIDGGATWNPTGLAPGSSPSKMNDIYIHPTNSNILWVATNNGVYKTTDAGVNWSNNLPNVNARDLKIKPGDPNTVYAVSSNRFYKSTDGGDSFVISNTGLPNASGRLVIDVTPANPNVVYVVSALINNGYQGVYRSDDSGDTFVQKANTQDIFQSNQAWYDLALAVSDTDEDEIYVGVLNIWKSNNGGDSFTQINQWNVRNQAYTHADIHFLRFYNNELYAGTDGGFFKSDDGGVSFTDLTVGMEISQFYRIDVSEQTSNKIAGGTQDNGSFAYFNQWNQFLAVTADGMEAVIDPVNDNLYYGFMQFGQVLTVSTTSGQGTSQAFGAPDTANWITPLNVNSEGEVYAGYSALWQFSNSSWSQISVDFGTNIDVLEIDFNDPDNMYIGTNNTLRKSTDRGVTFNVTESFATNINSIEVNNNDSNIIYVTTAGSAGNIYRSLDGGQTFTDISGTIPNVSKNVIKHRRNDVLNSLYVGTSLGVYRYDDNLGDWEEFDNNLPTVSVRDLAINIVDEKIVAGTYGRGIWISDMPAAELAQNDVRLVAVNNPTTNSFNCGDVTPEILVRNNGQNDIVDIDITYNIDGGADNNFTWNGTLAPSAEITIELPALSGLTRGEHSLDITLNVINDEFPGNNDGSITFYANDAGVAQLVNTFEAPEDELITFNEGGGVSMWERGVPTGPDLNTANSGTQVYGTNLDGNHPNLTKSYLYSQCYDLSAIVGPILKFHMAFEIEFDWDLAYVEYTLDEGQNWSLLGTANDPNWYNSSRFANDGVANNCFNCVGGQWTGTDLTMQEYSYALDALTNEPNVTFRMVYHSDQSVTFEGVIMDDFYVDGTLSTEEFSTSDILIYPNPSNDIFNIKLQNVSEFDYSVTDITGKVIMKELNISNTNFRLDMSALSTGMYFLKIDSEGRSMTKKLILN